MSVVYNLTQTSVNTGVFKIGKTFIAQQNSFDDSSLLELFFLNHVVEMVQVEMPYLSFKEVIQNE
jgi:hypothetical protein